MEIDARLQPHLGRTANNYKPQLDMLALAKVTKVHHSQGTVDLQLIKSNDVVSSDPSNDGKFGARVMTTTAYYDPASLSSSGVIEPMQEGQLVLIAFIDGKKSQPVVLGSFHQTWDDTNNILPMTYPLDPSNSMLDKREATKYLRVHPSQFYERVDGIGAKEVSHPSKTFMTVDPDLYGEINDAHDGFDHKDLNERDPFSGQSRYGKDEDSVRPVNMLFVHRSNFDDDVTTWLKMFISNTGMFRLTRDNNDGSLSYYEMKEDGTTTLRRQVDSNENGSGDNAGEISLGQDGSIAINRIVDGRSSSISLDVNGDIMLTHKSGSYIKLTDNGFEASGNGGSGLGYSVQATEPANAPDGWLWIDTSDIVG